METAIQIGLCLGLALILPILVTLMVSRGRASARARRDDGFIPGVGAGTAFADPSPGLAAPAFIAGGGAFLGAGAIGAWEATSAVDTGISGGDSGGGDGGRGGD